MNRNNLGRIKVITGEKNGKFPSCNSLYVDDDVKVVIDPGSSKEQLAAIKDRVDLVINTHFHFDHFLYNYMFDRAKIYLNEIEADCFPNRSEIMRRMGFAKVLGQDWLEKWLQITAFPNTAQISSGRLNSYEWNISTARLDGTYKAGETFDLGATQMTVIPAPGHSAGHSCFYFPEQGIVYTGDIDLNAFGPMYEGIDGDINQFIESAWKIAALDADWFVTSHEEMIVSRLEFRKRMTNYLAIIDFRQEAIFKALSRPMSGRELAELGLFYGKRQHIDDMFWGLEQLLVEKHLEKMLRDGLILYAEDKYYRL